MHKEFKINQHAVIIDDSGKVLLLKQDKHWMLPGGRLEDDATPKDGLLREIAEETGLSEIAVDAVVFVGLSATGETFLLVYSCSTAYQNPEIAISDEHQEYAWADPQDLDDYLFRHEEVKEIIKNAKAKTFKLDN